jgi:hypothetical protein
MRESKCIYTVIAVVFLVSVIIPVSGVDVASRVTSTTDAELNAAVRVQEKARYALPVHRYISDYAFSRVMARRKENEKSATNPGQESESIASVLNKLTSTNHRIGVLGKLKLMLKTSPDLLATKFLVSAGSGLDFLFGRRPEAKHILQKARTFDELLARVNLRLGVTYPDLPIKGNEPVLKDASLRAIALKLFSARYLAGGSLDAAKRTAGTHWGDRQFWHSMVDPASNLKLTNDDVVKQIKVYMRKLYQESRDVSPEKRWWYYGRMLHTIQDSYSDAHVARDVGQPGLPVHFFQNYAKQLAEHHAIADSSIEDDEKAIKDDPDSASSKLRARILRRKAQLYTTAVARSTELLDLLWDGAYDNTRAGTSDDLWPSIDKLLDKVYLFPNNRWRKAITGGALPSYNSKADSISGRLLDQMEYGSFDTNPMELSDTMHKHLNGYVRLTITKIVATNLPSADFIGTTDPFLTISNGLHTLFVAGEGELQKPKTSVKGSRKRKQTSQPEFVWELDHSRDMMLYTPLEIDVYDSDVVLAVPRPEDSEWLGMGKIDPAEFLASRPTAAATPISVTKVIRLKRKDGTPAGKLTVTATATRVASGRGTAPLPYNDWGRRDDAPASSPFPRASPLDPERLHDSKAHSKLFKEKLI